MTTPTTPYQGNCPVVGGGRQRGRTPSPTKTDMLNSKTLPFLLFIYLFLSLVGESRGYIEKKSGPVRSLKS